MWLSILQKAAVFHRICKKHAGYLYLLVSAMVSYSKVRCYKEEEVNLDELSHISETILGKKLFQWQLEAAVSVLVIGLVLGATIT